MLYQGQTPKLSNKKKLNIQVDEFNGGTNTLFSQTRLKKNESAESLNLILIEDGVWDKRWGTEHYGGVTWDNRPDGASEYRKTDGTRELIVVADGKVWKVNVSAGTKTEITGATFTQGQPAFFLQSNDRLYISNTVDDLAYYDGTDMSTFAALSTPTWDGTPLTRGAGLSAGVYSHYYRVAAANEVGTTIASTEQTITTDIPREEWDEADEYIDLAFPDVSGADKYIIYYSDSPGFEVKLIEVNASEYRDTGAAIPNPYVEPQDDNTTTAPKFGPMTISANRMWAAGDPNNPWRVYFSGTGASLGNFSSAFGGGWVNLERGGRAVTTTVLDFQGKTHVLCKTDDGQGTIWQVTVDNVTIDEETFSVPIPTKIITAIGTNSPRSVVYVENDVFFFNRGVFVLGNEPGILNVLRTNELSIKIRPFIEGLNEASLSGVCAYYYQNKVFFSVPTVSGYPNRIFIFDRERTCLIKDWDLGVSQFLEFTDSSGNTHLLGIAEDRLIRFSPNIIGDQGNAFTWKYTSPRFPVSKAWDEFARIRKALVRLRSVSGSVNVEVRGSGKTQAFTAVASATIEIGISQTGMGWDIMAEFLMGDTNGAPSVFSEDTIIRHLFMNGLLRDVQISISGDELQDRATILGIIIEGFQSGVQGPLSWGLDG